MTTYTIFGGGGFIGSALAYNLLAREYAVYQPISQHGMGISKEALQRNLGHVFYCIGMTANFRGQPFNTVEAHVCLLKQLLEHGHMTSLTYLSSTRVYESSSSTKEDALLQASPGNPEHLYNFSKLMGESLALNSGIRTKVVRLSNVYGRGMAPNNFLSLILRESANTGHVRFLTSRESSKDFISLEEVVRLLPRIATDGRHGIYNLASGKNTANAEIANLLNIEGVKSSFESGVPEWSFPPIDIQRLIEEFGMPRVNFNADITQLLDYYRDKESK